MEWSWKIHNLSLCRKIILTLPFGSEFPPASRDVTKTAIRPFSIGLQQFFSSNGLRKYTIWVYVDKYLNIARLFRNSPGSRNEIAYSFRPFSLRDFLQKWLSRFLKKTSLRFLRFPFFSPSVCQPVSQSVGQSVSPSVRQLICTNLLLFLSA